MIINTVCNSGSTGRISAEIASLAQQRGHNVCFAYGRGSHPDDIQGYKIGNRIDFICHVLLNFVFGKSGFGSRIVTKRFLNWLKKNQPDIINIHNLHGFYIHVGMFFDYIKANDIPVVWTLHDCWSFTGQCAHFDYVGCDKWKRGCYKCPIFRTEYPYSLFCDNSEKNYIDKRRVFTGVKNLIIVTPSEWLSNLVKDSFLKEYEVKIINNGIDLNKFRIIRDDKSLISELREQNNISEQKKVVLGVANVWTERKGLNSFYQLANILPEEYIIVLVGISTRIAKTIKNKYRGKIIGIKHTESIDELVCWYNLADVFVNPTLEDNFPTTNIEALACGTPVVTYKTGGSPESIDDNCGIVVDRADVVELRNAVIFAGSRKIHRDICRNRAEIYSKTDRLMQYVLLMESMAKSEN